jgi:hypothetical protein
LPSDETNIDSTEKVEFGLLNPINADKLFLGFGTLAPKNLNAGSFLGDYHLKLKQLVYCQNAA